jgi:hypothetical protein
MLNFLKVTRELFIEEEKYGRSYIIAREGVIRLDLVANWFEVQKEDVERRVNSDENILDVGRTEVWFENTDEALCIRMSVEDFTTIMEGYYHDVDELGRDVDINLGFSKN